MGSDEQVMNARGAALGLGMPPRYTEEEIAQAQQVVAWLEVQRQEERQRRERAMEGLAERLQQPRAPVLEARVSALEATLMRIAKALGVK